MSWLETVVPFTKQFEGCELTAYPDPASGGDPWTIGFGATGPEIVKGTVWTQEQADADLTTRMAAIGARIDQLVTKPLTNNQKAALADFIYNVGVWAFTKSTMRRFLNAGFMTDACAQFSKWTLADNKVVLGLVKRRKAEAALFSSPDA